MQPEIILDKFWIPTLAFLKSGGWGMWALALNGLVIYALGFATMLRLSSCGVFVDAESLWRKWHRSGKKTRGPVATILEEALDCPDTDAIGRFFAATRSDESNPLMGNLRAMTVSVSTAPLLGLLGTVTGMLATFDALANGGGGEKTMSLIAGGISEALITTEAGLVLALGGMFFLHVLMRLHSRYLKLLTHLEVLCTQKAQRSEWLPIAALPVETNEVTAA